MHAIFKSAYPRLFGKSDPASIRFTDSASEDERMFLFLVLIRMESRRLEVELQ